MAAHCHRASTEDSRVASLLLTVGSYQRSRAVAALTAYSDCYQLATHLGGTLMPLLPAREYAIFAMQCSPTEATRIQSSDGGDTVLRNGQNPWLRGRT